MLTDFPKLECPFVRKTFKVDRDDWKKYGRELQLRQPEVYLAVDEVNPGFEWVFDDPDTIAVEKLDGTNIKILTHKGRLILIQNRTNIIDPMEIMKGKNYIHEGIFQSIDKGYVKETGEQVGELIGPKVQGNPYRLNVHLWYPFEKAIDQLSYKSFHEHDRTFDNWSSWFKEYLFSRFATKRDHKDVMAEGVIFYNLKRQAQEKSWRAKLRRNMFDWFYTDKVKILNYIQGEGYVHD